MSNPAFMDVCIVGDRRQLRSLYNKMWRLQNRRKSLVENTFYFATRWLGNLVVRLGADWQEVECRGTWDGLQLKAGVLSFSTESAWQPPLEVLRLIKRVYPGLQIYFEAVGDGWDFYLTNDAEGRFFTSRFELDMPTENEYYDTIAEVAEHVGTYIGRHIAPTPKAVFAAIDEWEQANDDLEAYINLKTFEVIEDL